MNGWRLTWALLLVSYITAIEAIALFWTSTLSLTSQTLANAALVPLAQALALGLVRSRPPGFFVAWGVLAVVQAILLALVGILVFRSMPLSDAMFFTLLFVPLVQAAAITLSADDLRALLAAARQAARAPVSHPVLWIDGLVISVGVLLFEHPLLGLAAAGTLQRRWMATKLFVASVLLARIAFHHGRGDSPARGRTTLAATAIVFAMLGADSFAPWIFDLASHLPAPLDRQPTGLRWLQVYGLLLALVTLLVRRSARQLTRAAPSASVLLNAGAVMFFTAGMALLMNGFLSLQPVTPWAPVSLLAATLAASTFAIASIAANRRI